MPRGDKEKVKFIVDYLCDLDKPSLKRFFGRHEVPLGMVIDLAWERSIKLTKRQLLGAKLDEIDRFTIDRMYDSVKSAY